jgi:hypothetical protein
MEVANDGCLEFFGIFSGIFSGIFFMEFSWIFLWMSGIFWNFLIFCGCLEFSGIFLFFVDVWNFLEFSGILWNSLEFLLSFNASLEGPFAVKSIVAVGANSPQTRKLA